MVAELKTDFTPWVKRWEQLDEAERGIVNFIVNLRAYDYLTNPNILEMLVDMLNGYYALFAAMDSKKTQSDMREKLKGLRQKCRTFFREEILPKKDNPEEIQFPDVLYDEIDDLYYELLQHRQDVGLGWPARRVVNENETLKRSIDI